MKESFGKKHRDRQYGLRRPWTKSKFFQLRSLTIALLVAGIGSPAHADLARVGPANVPSPPGNGFPLWYQDLSGTVLDLCLPNAGDPGQLQQTACLQAGTGVEPPYVFPSNFPDEAFFFQTASLPISVNGTAATTTVELALEAAFGTGAPQAGQQMVFARLRIRGGVPVPGNYTVTHPYGVEPFEVTTAGGPRDINFTDDIGITPGAFSDALRSRLGPFLQHADAPGGNVLPPLTVNQVQFLSDGATPEFVTGSPFGTNYVMICGPVPLGTFGPGGEGTGTCAGVSQFTLVGRLRNLATNPIGSPLAVTRATYGRDTEGTHVDVNANVVRALPNQPNPVLTAASANQVPVAMTGPTVLGDYYAQGITDPSGALPNPVTVINSADSPPSTLTRNVVDVVSVISATYAPADDTLTVVATSSDKGFSGSLPPRLVLEGFPDATVSQNTSGSDPADAILTATGVATPPPSVTVLSSAGGIGRADVVGSLDQLAPFTAGVVFAQDDSAAATAGGAPVAIPVLVNDVSNPAARPSPVAPVAILAPGLPAANGTLAVHPTTGEITFTPSAAVGTFTFRYTVVNAIGRSNPATVTLTVAPGAGGPTPIANPDPGPNSVNPNSSTTLNVLANDSGNGGTLDPASVVISGVTGGTAVANANGTVRFTSGAAPGIFGFDYTVANTNGNRSISTHVTVTVVQEQVAVVTNRCTRNGTLGQWNVRGTGSIAGSVITLFPSANGTGTPMGTPVTVDGTNAWVFRQNLNAVPCRSPISLRSSLGTSVNNIAIRIQ